MIDVELDIGLEWSSSGFGQSEVEKAVDAAIKFATIPALADPPVPVSVSVKLSDALLVGKHEAPEIMLGDIILAYGVCQAEAAEKNIAIADHAAHLVIHGMLHLLGHDHIDEQEAEAMEALEVKALASMGLHNPYSD
ncbi:MAG: rRNA maturation RNase YbeY [Usitatibacteraceae bacterium]